MEKWLDDHRIEPLYLADREPGKVIDSSTLKRAFYYALTHDKVPGMFDGHARITDPLLIFLRLHAALEAKR